MYCVCVCVCEQETGGSVLRPYQNKSQVTYHIPLWTERLPLSLEFMWANLPSHPPPQPGVHLGQPPLLHYPLYECTVLPL